MEEDNEEPKAKRICIGKNQEVEHNIKLHPPLQPKVEPKLEPESKCSRIPASVETHAEPPNPIAEEETNKTLEVSKLKLDTHSNPSPAAERPDNKKSSCAIKGLLN